MSSVSSRQREGGSLPNNVNSSSTYSLSSFPLSKYSKANAKNNVKNKLESHDYERNPTNHHRTAFIGESVSYCEEKQPSIASTSASVVNANDKNHTIINIDDPEEARHLLAHDSLAQVCAKSAVHFIFVLKWLLIDFILLFDFNLCLALDVIRIHLKYIEMMVPNYYN